MTFCKFFALEEIRPTLNWTGIEKVTGIRPFIIKNCCLRKGFKFTASELENLHSFFHLCHSKYLSLPLVEFLIDNDVRKIFNWRGLESAAKIDKKRIYTFAVSKYPIREEEVYLLNNYFDYFFETYYKTLQVNNLA